MKLIIAIVQNEDASILSDSLMEEGFSATKLSTTGGFLKKSNVTLLIGSADDTVDLVLDIIKKTSRKREELVSVPTLSNVADAGFPSPTLNVNVGGATVFVLDVAQFQNF